MHTQRNLFSRIANLIKSGLIPGRNSSTCSVPTDQSLSPTCCAGYKVEIYRIPNAVAGTALLSRKAVLHYQNLPSGLSRSGIQVVATQSPAYILIFPESPEAIPGKYGWALWLDVAATCRSEPGQARRKRSQLKLEILFVPDGDTSGSYPIHRVHSYFSRNRFRRFRAKYWWVFWRDVAATCRSEPGQAWRKRSELKLYVLQAPVSRSVTKTTGIFEAVKLLRLATLNHAIFIRSTGFIRLKALYEHSLQKFPASKRLPETRACDTGLSANNFG